jgi:Putative Actinobacterial Holin-X, holin superfamily III
MRRIGRASRTEAGTGLGDLVERLVSQLGRFLEQRLALARSEVTRGLRALTRDAVLLVAGAVLALLGALYLVTALALWVSDLVDSPAGGFALVGAVVILAGAVAAVLGLRGFRRHSVVPTQTVTELRRDVAWIRNEL